MSVQAGFWRTALIAVGTFFCLAKLTFLTVYAIQTRYVMDEYAQGGYSIHIPDGFYRAIDPIKTVLYVYFYEPARWMAKTSNELVLICRLQTLLLVLAVLAMLWWWEARLGFRLHERLFSICVILAFSNFLEQSFRIRSDSVAVFFDVAAFVALTVAANLSLRRAFFVGLLVGLGFLCTQKAVYAVVAVGAAIIAEWGRTPARRMIGAAVASAAGFWLALLLYALYFGGLDFVRVLQMMTAGPMDLALHGTQYYPYSLRIFTKITLVQNTFAYALCGIGLVVAAFREWRGDIRIRRAAAFTVVFITLIFLHPQPWPYVFSAAIPYLSLFSVYTIRVLESRASADAVALVAILILTFSFQRNFVYLPYNNRSQREVAAQAERFLGPADRYQDGVGMITTRRLAGEMWWDTMNIALFRRAFERHDYSQLHTIVANQPKLWIVNYKVVALWPILKTIINHSYVAVTPNILLSGVYVDRQPTTFVTRWCGPYDGYAVSDGSKPSSITIDGRAATLPVRLTCGVHRLEPAPGVASSFFFLPSGLPLRAVRPVVDPPIDLYANVYP